MPLGEFMPRVSIRVPKNSRARVLTIIISAVFILFGSAAVPTAAQATPVHNATPPTRPTPLTAAGASQRAKASKKPVVVDSMTTATTQVTANPDGSFTRTQSLRPTRMQRNGTWVNLDPTLHPNTNGTVSPNATSGDVALSGGGTGPFATLIGAGHEVSFTLPMTLPAPTISGATATYANVLPNVDLAVTVDGQGGVSDVFVVKTAAAATNPALQSLRITTATQGLTVSSDAGNNLWFDDATGTPVYSATAPLMWDSAPIPSGITSAANAAGQQMDVQTGLPVTSTPQSPAEQAHRAPVAVSVSDNTIVLTPNAALFTAASTTYPVDVDPSISFNPDSYGGNADWTEVESGFPNQTMWHQSGQEQVGDCGWPGCNGLGVARSLFQVSTGPLRGTTIISAWFNVTDEYAPSCAAQAQGDHNMDLYFLQSSISPGTDWNNQPGVVAGGPIGAVSVMFGYNSSCPAAAIGYNITSALKSVIGEVGNVIDFQLRADDESNPYGWKQLADNANWSVQYDVPPVTPFTPTMSPAVACTGNPANATIGPTDVTLSVQTATASDGVAKPLNVEFRVTNTTTGATANDTTIQTTAGAWATVYLPQATFSSGGNYSWSTQATDGLLGSAWSGACAFEVDTTRPGIPAVTPGSSAPATCTSFTTSCTVPIRAALPVTFAPGGSGSTPASYRYQVNSGTPVVVTATNGSATPTIPLNQFGANTITVQGLSAGGTPSAEPASVQITTTAPATPDTDSDFTGDGKPDLLTIGGTNGVPSGLWLAQGNGDGTVANPTDIGINGSGQNTTGTPADWNGALVTHGQFTADGLQDLLAVFPASAGGTQTARIYTSPGNGSALNPNISQSLQGQCFRDSAFECLTANETITQITAIGRLPEDTQTCGVTCGSAYPDLLAVVDNKTSGQDSYQLWWLPAAAGEGNYVTATEVWDSTLDWKDSQISGLQVNGQPALEVRNTLTGELDLYTSNPGGDPTGNWFASAVKTVLLSSSSTGYTSTYAVDATSDGNPDLWATDATGHLYFGKGGANATTPTMTTPTSDGSVAPATKTMTSYGATTWTPPGGSVETDVYYTTSANPTTLYRSTETPGGQLGPATAALPPSTWSHYRPVGIADMNHDGYPDLVAIDTNTNTATDPNAQDELVFPGSATGFATTPAVLGTGWTSAFTPFGIGDWNHDGHYDTVATDSNGILWYYPGDLTGGVSARVEMNSGWTSAFAPYGIGDVTGDGHNDILTCTGGVLRLYPGDVTGGSAPVTTVDTTCATQTFVGLTHYTGHVQDDLIVQDNTSHNLIVNPGPGSLGSVTSLGTNIGSLSNLTGVHPIGAITWTNPATNTKRTDIYVADSSGNVWDYTETPANPAPMLSHPTTPVLTGWTHYTSVGVGDMNLDGYPDLVAVDTTTNDEVVFTGSATGQFTLSTTVVGGGWTSNYLPFGVADWQNNGHYGTLAVDQSTNTMYFYPGDLTKVQQGGGSIVIGTGGWSSNWTPVGTGDVTGDGLPDLVTCRHDTNSLLVYPNTTSGSMGTIGTMLTSCEGQTYLGVTDYTGDGHPDLITMDTNNNVWIDPGSGTNGWLAPNPDTIAIGW